MALADTITAMTEATTVITTATITTTAVHTIQETGNIAVPAITTTHSVTEQVAVIQSVRKSAALRNATTAGNIAMPTVSKTAITTVRRTAITTIAEAAADRDASKFQKHIALAWLAIKRNGVLPFLFLFTPPCPSKTVDDNALHHRYF